MTNSGKEFIGLHPVLYMMSTTVPIAQLKNVWHTHNMTFDPWHM